ncbi:3-deoxy-D-manno-octulosonate 8-phosphate phosphatase [Sphingobacterium sp. ML3W]|uniref:KdsC family phosphatase n=1 Tax=Sphingobacterium sp. ML3W TaxID=1538644 RepID=UPI0004F61D30|nr:HAD-IIIA family hydrolase [Sphingobacterium sp. ML3W]AIM35885.1 3-deoxy-D-manno-octulosonate 8-phosphate phosphatase [Sphingobacterium sp. ML3W]
MIFDNLKKVKAFVLDVDGVLTDGRVLVNEDGHQMRSFNIKDGYVLQLAVKRGYPVIIITGGNSKGVVKRLEGLGIKEVHSGISNKMEKLKEILERYNLEFEDILYMGDDMPDLPCMQFAGLATCPSDAIEEVKKVCHYISPVAGGFGAVRDVMEKVLKIQGRWELDHEIRSI